MSVNVARLQEYNNTLLKRVADLEQQNALLKMTIRESMRIGLPVKLPPKMDLTVPEGERDSWTDKSPRFDYYRELLFRTAYGMCVKTGCMVHQDEVLRAFKAQHSTLAAKMGPETGPRRLREIAEMGWLSKPKDAYYWFGSRIATAGEEKEAETHT